MSKTEKKQDKKTRKIENSTLKSGMKMYEFN